MARSNGNAVIELSDADAARYAANSFTLVQGNEARLLMPAGVSDHLLAQIRERGVTPITVDVSEFLEKGGGSVKCMIGDLGSIGVGDARNGAHSTGGSLAVSADGRFAARRPRSALTERPYPDVTQNAACSSHQRRRVVLSVADEADCRVSCCGSTPLRVLTRAHLPGLAARLCSKIIRCVHSQFSDAAPDLSTAASCTCVSQPADRTDRTREARSSILVRWRTLCCGCCSGSGA